MKNKQKYEIKKIDKRVVPWTISNKFTAFFSRWEEVLFLSFIKNIDDNDEKIQWDIFNEALDLLNKWESLDNIRKMQEEKYKV